MRGRTIEWEDEKQKSLVQHIVDTSHKISMNAAGRGNSGIIFSPYVASVYTMFDVSSEEYKKRQKERHQQEIRNAAEEWK
jgi:dihydroxyacetone kinase-like predicted kinase